MNTRKRLAAMGYAGLLRETSVLENPACVMGPGQRCEHALVDEELNARLYAYEQTVQGRFVPIVDTLKTISAFQHELDFVARAQGIAQDRLGYELPNELLENAWVSGLDLRALHSYCIFRSFKECIDNTAKDQAPWRDRMLLDGAFIRGCGYHTVDVSPCADGRLQGLLPFVFRVAPDAPVRVKAYAGALFDVEGDVADWAERELLRFADNDEDNYLKIAVYHFSSSNPSEHGCAAHGSNDDVAMKAAATRLSELRAAIENIYGLGAAPDTLLVGVDTDTDAIRIHLPGSDGANEPERFVESARLFRETLGLSADDARHALEEAVVVAEGGCDTRPGLRQFILRLLEANLSQIQYVIQHHEGRYQVIGHNERFICAGEAMNELQLRNNFYFAHLDTVEEAVADLDVGVNIFTDLNIRHGLPAPVLVHFHYSSRVPGGGERAVARCRRVRGAIEARYARFYEQGLLHCQMAVSDVAGNGRCTFVEEETRPVRH